MNLEDKTGKGTRHSKEVNIVTQSLTIEEARALYPYRPHNKYSESRFGGNTMADDAALLIAEDAKRCGMCSAPTKVRYLIEESCPDCDGRSEYNGTDPRASVK